MRRFRQILPASDSVAAVSPDATREASPLFFPRSRPLSPRLNGSSARPAGQCARPLSSSGQPEHGNKGLTAQRAGMDRRLQVVADGRPHAPGKLRCVARPEKRKEARFLP